MSFTGFKGESVRIGINPYGAHRVQLFDQGKELAYNQDTMKSVQCQQENQGSKWSCSFEVCWSLLPPNIRFFQMIHAHVNLEGEEEREFVGAACPGFSDGSPYADQITDWRGCEIDGRVVVNEYSDVWRDAMKETSRK